MALNPYLKAATVGEMFGAEGQGEGEQPKTPMDTDSACRARTGNSACKAGALLYATSWSATRRSTAGTSLVRARKRLEAEDEQQCFVEGP